MCASLWHRVGLPAAVALAMIGSAQAQTVRSGSVSGTITDESGAGMPGVTVTLTSPALQVPQLTQVSDGRGEYQLVGLSAGTYRVVFDLPGFAQVVREDIRVTTGFAARVDAQLRVASLAESITVSGRSPLVDVTNTRGGATVTREVLAAVPSNLTHQDLMLLAGGASSPVAPLSGQTGIVVTGSNNSNKTYGQSVRMNNSIEGIKAMPGESPDFVATEEVDLKTFGNTADVDLPGALIQVVFKSGGNQFHGRYVARAQHKRFQSSNLDAELRGQGVRQGDAVQYFTDLFGDLGGRIVENKLWFYASRRDLRNERSALGYARDPGGDNVYGTADDTPGFPPSQGKNTLVKISYQATNNHKLIGLWARNPLDDPESVYGRFTPFESTQPYNQVNRQSKVEWQGVLSQRLVANAMFADAGYTATRDIQPSSLGIPNRLNRSSGYQTGGSFLTTWGRRRPWREQASGSVTYYPGWSGLGSHEITAGFRSLWGRFLTDFPARPDGVKNVYRLVYDTISGIPYQPAELHALSYPVEGRSRNNVHAAYVSNSWRPLKRLTINLGLRFERVAVWVPEQTKEQGQFGTAGAFPAVDVGSWNVLAPRVGAAWDLSGDGRVVAKATYGKYNHTEFNTGVPLTWQDAYNQNGVTTYAYRWRDQDRNNDYTPGEINLDLNGPDFLSVSGGTNNLLNPDLRMPATHEVTASLEREFLDTWSVRGLYVYTNVVDTAVTSVNVLRPYDVWNQPFTRRDPGPDGVLGNQDDAGLITFYDYDPAFRGSRFVANMLTNGRSNSFNSFELTLNKRPGRGRAFASTSVLVTKNHNWLVSAAQSPNDEFFPLDETLDVTFRLAGGYRLPWGFNTSTLYQAYRGGPGRRTVLFGVRDAAGGPSLPSSGSITIPVEPFGAQRGPSRHIVNLRLSKEFPLGGSRRFVIDVDAFNAFNSNVPWGGGSGTGGGTTSINYQAGPTFGYVTSIVSPRALQFGVSFEF